MCEAISKSNVAYRGPAYNAMRTDLLDAVKCRVENDSQSWSDHGKKVTGLCAWLRRVDRCTESTSDELYACDTKRHKVCACS